jgi:hypothetical protein
MSVFKTSPLSDGKTPNASGTTNSEIRLNNALAIVKDIKIAVVKVRRFGLNKKKQINPIHATGSKTTLYL